MPLNGREYSGKAVRIIAFCFGVAGLVGVIFVTAWIGLLSRNRLPNGYYVFKMAAQTNMIASEDRGVVVFDNVYRWHVSAPFVWGSRKPGDLNEKGEPENSYFLLNTATGELTEYKSRTLFEHLLTQHGLDVSTVDHLLE